MNAGTITACTMSTLRAALGFGHGTCSTATATAAKTVTLSNFVRFTGSIVTVTFTYSNTVASATLNVNSTGAATIYYHGAALTASDIPWQAGEVVAFVYDGTYWRVMATEATVGDDYGDEG